MEVIVPSIIILGTIGLAFGFGLAYVARKLAVVEDQRVEEVLDVLPGTDCGGCGNANCRAFAKALLTGDSDVGDCVVGGREVAEMVSSILGEEVGEIQPMVAQVFCQGGKSLTKERFAYTGRKTCSAAALVSGGYKACAYGCLHFGDCMKACQFGAITMSEDGLPIIDKEKCTGCGDCVRACPKRIIYLVPKDAKMHVRCSSKDPGKVVNKVCDVGCIGCRRCIKPSEGAIVFDEEANLARRNYEKDIEPMECVEVCPKNTIVMEKRISEEAKAA